MSSTPTGKQANTIWIWLVVFLPLIPNLALFTIDWNQLIPSDPEMVGSFSLLFSPGYLLTMFSGWIVYALCALFAYFDWRHLNRIGISRPFHFAWVFLSSVAYVIGRAVIVRRRTGSGIAPMWAAIATVVFSFGVATYLMIVVFSAVFASISAIETTGFS